MNSDWILGKKLCLSALAVVQGPTKDTGHHKDADKQCHAVGGKEIAEKEVGGR